jgi:CDP-diglyceride synthetase
MFYNCYDYDTQEFIGMSSILPQPHEEHYFGDILYVCVSTGDSMAYFTKKQFEGEKNRELTTV